MLCTTMFLEMLLKTQLVLVVNFDTSEMGKISCNVGTSYNM